MGHARALLGVDAAHQIQFANRIVAKGLSVREAETLVAHASKDGGDGTKKAAAPRSRDIVRLEEELADKLGATVRLSANAKGSGKLVIEFAEPRPARRHRRAPARNLMRGALAGGWSPADRRREATVAASARRRADACASSVCAATRI